MLKITRANLAETKQKVANWFVILKMVFNHGLHMHSKTVSRPL